MRTDSAQQKKEICNKLAESFTEVSSTQSYSWKSREHKEAEERDRLNITSNNEEAYNAAFERQELDNILANLANSAPGLDGVNYDMIKNLPNSAKDHLFKIYNKCYEKHQ